MMGIDALEEVGGTEARCRHGYKMGIFAARFYSNNSIANLDCPALIADFPTLIADCLALIADCPALIADRSTNIHHTADRCGILGTEAVAV